MRAWRQLRDPPFLIVIFTSKNRTKNSGPQTVPERNQINFPPVIYLGDFYIRLYRATSSIGQLSGLNCTRYFHPTRPKMAMFWEARSEQKSVRIVGHKCTNIRPTRPKLAVSRTNRPSEILRSTQASSVSTDSNQTDSVPNHSTERKMHSIRACFILTDLNKTG